MRSIVEYLQRLRYERVELTRAVMYAYVFAPLANVLPSGVLRLLAHIVAVPMILIDGMGRVARHEYRYVFPDRSGLCLYYRQQVKRFFEHAWQHRVIAGTDRPDNYHIHVDASERVMQIIGGTGSIVIASGHFIRGPETFALTLPKVTNRPFYVIVADPPSAPRDFHEWRVQLQLSVTIRAMQAWAPPGWVNAVYRGKAFLRVLQEIKSKDSVLFINVDAHWPKGRGETVTIPFAGFSSRTFATGAARAARMANCPLLLMIPVPIKGREAVLQILGPYRSDLQDELERDADVTRQLLTDIERAIGERPEEYVMDIGHERIWNRTSRVWEADSQSRNESRIGTNSGVTG